MSAERRTLFDEVLELAVYVPVGMATKVIEQVPGLAAAGRARVGNQVDQARVIGRFAVGLARSRAARSVRSRRPPTAHPPSSADPRDHAPGRPADPGSVSATAPPPPHAIPDYDALSASQVVPRLRGLSRDELAAVGRYEAATRQRRTILGRIAQLQRDLGDH